MEEAQQLQEIPVRPTAVQVTEQYADIALSGLFNVHAGQISSERQTIWQRYTAMLFANSIIFAFGGGSGRPFYQTIGGPLFGIMLCVLWLGMTISGWRVFRMRIDLALQFIWTNLSPRANPFAVTIEYEAGSFGGSLFRLALGVILLFALLHTVVLIGSFVAYMGGVLPIVP